MVNYVIGRCYYMRKLKELLLAIFTFILATSTVGAATSACEVKTVAQLNSEVANIKADYEEAEGILDPNYYTIPDAILGTEAEETYVGTYNYFKVSIVNITENFYVEVTNDVDDSVQTYTYADATDGVVTFNLESIEFVVNFTIKVYSTNQSGCSGELFRTLYLTTPRINPYYNYNICREAPDYYLCQKYVTFDEDVDFYSFVKKVQAYIDKKDEEKQTEENETWLEKTGHFISEHKVVFITGGVIILVGVGVAVVVIVRKRRSSII